MAAKELNCTVMGDPGAVRAVVAQVLTSRGFTVTWQDDSTEVAVRGSRVANILFGAFAQYFKVGVRIAAGQPGETFVHIERLSSGWGGGFVGVAQTRRILESLDAELEAALRQVSRSRGVTAV
jgi:hypothetical protein